MPIQSVAPRIRSKVCRNLSNDLNQERNTFDETIHPDELPVEPVKIRIEYISAEPTAQDDLLSPVSQEISSISQDSLQLQIPTVKSHSPISICSIEYCPSDITSEGNFNKSNREQSIQWKHQPVITTRCCCGHNNGVYDELNTPIEKGQTLLTDYFPKLTAITKYSNTRQSKKRQDVLDRYRNGYLKLYKHSGRDKLLNKSNKILRKYLYSSNASPKINKSPPKLTKSYLYINKFNKIVSQFICEIHYYQCLYGQNCTFLLCVFNCIKTIDIYVSLLLDLKMNASTLKRPKIASSNNDDFIIAIEDVPPNKLSKPNEHTVDGDKIDDSSIESASTEPIITSVPAIPTTATKRGQKGNRTENTKLMLLPEAKEDTHEKDNGNKFKIYILTINKSIIIFFI